MKTFLCRTKSSKVSLSLPIVYLWVYVVVCIFQFLYVEPSLLLWDEAYLVRVGDVFDVSFN